MLITQISKETEMKKLFCLLALKAVCFSVLSLVVFSNNTGAETTLLRTYFHSDAPPRYFEINNMDTGICLDIIHELNARLEPNGISIVNPNNEKVPVKRIQYYLEQNAEIDLFVGAALTEDLVASGIQFSVPLYSLNGAFAKRRDDPFVFVNPDSLKGLTVGVLRGSRSVETMTNIEGVTVEETSTMEQSLKKLAVGRVDLVYYHDMGLAWQIKHFNLGDNVVLAEMDEKFDSAPHYIIFSKNASQKIITAINTAIESMQADGSMDRILQKYR